MTLYQIDWPALPALASPIGLARLRARTMGLAAVATLSAAMGLAEPTRAQQSTPDKPSSGFVYTADEKGNSLSRVDLSTGRVQTVVAPISPHNVQIGADGRWLYAVGSPAMKGESHGEGGQHGRLLVFDAAALDRGPIADIGVGEHPAHVIVDQKGAYAFVTNGGDGTVSAVDLAQKRVAREIKVGKAPHGFRMSPNGREIYVANVGDGTLSVIGTAEMALVGTIAVGKEPVQVGFTADGRWVYASLRGENSVAVVDVAARRLVTKVPVGRGPIQVFATPDSRYVFVANQGDANPDDTVSVIEVATNRVVKTIVTGKGAHGVVVSNDGRWVFVSNIAANTVSVVDVRTLAVVATFTVGRGPNGITFKSADPASRT